MIEHERRRIRRARRPVREGPPRVIAYTRVSTEEQADSGGGLDAQRATLNADLARRGWSEIDWIEDRGYSAKDLNRPGIAAALAKLAAGEADVLIVARLDRLSRSVFDFAGLMKQATEEGWSLVALDLGVDTASPAGEMMAAVVASFAQYERRLIAARTKAGMAAKKAAGTYKVKPGRPPTMPADLRARIAAMRSEGKAYAAIAEALNAEGIAPVRGGARWYPSTVQRALTVNARNDL